MATYGGGTGPNPVLLRGTCVGCHAYNIAGSNNVVDINGSQIPQVWHNAGTDLAAGNFKYVDGADYGKGHNVIDFFGTNSDGVLDAPPGLLPVGGHPAIINDAYLTCTGFIGCHGIRSQSIGDGVKGAHHGNVDGKCDTADTVANSYRFLLGVKGLENTTNRWQNVDANSHNEYFGADTPMDVNCDILCCHPSGITRSPNNTISGFCATCHGQFHDKTEIGGTTSPFQRHPTDIVIKNSDEYEAAKRTYNARAPVGRTTVPDSVITGATENDVVTCLSCHAAHASDYPDMLKWDYTTMIAGGGGSGGCFTCHTEKN